MADLNTITLGCAVVTEPELRLVGGGKNTSMCRMRVAYNKRRKRDDEWVDDKSYFTVITWGELADMTAGNLKVGSQVIIQGALKQNEWVDKEGNKRNDVEITANQIAVSLPKMQRQLIPDDPTGGDLSFLD